MNENNGAIRDASVLGVPKMLILGLQHMFAMFGATILVPILVNSYFGEDVLHVQVTLICAGVGTLFFHLCSKFKVPAFLGSSFAFLGGFATIANLDTGVFADMSNADKLSYACGGIVVAGLLYLILALIIRLAGVKKVMRFLPPVVIIHKRFSVCRSVVFVLWFSCSCAACSLEISKQRGICSRSTCRLSCCNSFKQLFTFLCRCQ